MSKPVALDLCSGLGGWADGLEAEGWSVIRVDLHDMFAETGTPKPSECLLMLQDILTFHGSQAKHCRLIVASPPCQKYSWMAMPWSIAKAEARAIRADTTGAEMARLNALFNACFRIQSEACEAAGRHIPMVVENVRGAQPWVGRARYNFGSYYLWGDVSLVMPRASSPSRQGGQMRRVAEGRKGAGAGAEWFDGNLCVKSSNSPARKLASAAIAKIPMTLARHIGRVYHPNNEPPALMPTQLTLEGL